MTASRDGRLGRGKKIKVVDQGMSSWSSDVIRRRFQQPIGEQWKQVFAGAAIPPDGRGAGWDLVFLHGAVVGGCGPELMFRCEEGALRLGIEQETPSLAFRDNLRMLCHAPDLELQVVARLDVRQPSRICPLAIAWSPQDAKDAASRLALPDSWHERVCLGFDELQRAHLPDAVGEPVSLPDEQESFEADPLTSLQRRWVALLLSGATSPRLASTSSLSSEIDALQKCGFRTGASLLKAICESQAASRERAIDCFLATAIYLRTCRFELASSPVVQA